MEYSGQTSSGSGKLRAEFCVFTICLETKSQDLGQRFQMVLTCFDPVVCLCFTIWFTMFTSSHSDST